MPAGIDHGRGLEPGPTVIHHISPKDDALAAARAAGLAVMEGRYVVQKYRGDVAKGDLYEVVESAPNLFLTSGVATILGLITGAGSTHFDGSNARLCVGDGITAASAAQTDLVGTNKLRKVVSAAPGVSNNSVSFAATFTTAEANFDWREVGVANAASGAGSMWSRAVINLGTKVSSASWVLNWTLSIS